eukprot:935968-Pelagomonas_calceolata.AAC.1
MHRTLVNGRGRMVVWPPAPPVQALASSCLPPSPTSPTAFTSVPRVTAGTRGATACPHHPRLPQCPPSLQVCCQLCRRPPACHHGPGIQPGASAARPR